MVKETLPEILKAEKECQDANVEESDYTVYTYEDLEFETGLVKEAVAKKKAFLENQVRSPTLHYMSKHAFTDYECIDRRSDNDEIDSSPIRGIRKHLPTLRQRANQHSRTSRVLSGAERSGDYILR